MPNNPSPGQLQIKNQHFPHVPHAPPSHAQAHPSHAHMLTALLPATQFPKLTISPISSRRRQFPLNCCNLCTHLFAQSFVSAVQSSRWGLLWFWYFPNCRLPSASTSRCSWTVQCSACNIHYVQYGFPIQQCAMIECEGTVFHLHSQQCSYNCLTPATCAVCTTLDSGYSCAVCNVLILAQLNSIVSTVSKKWPSKYNRASF